jgi:uncharacterized protein
VPGTLTAPTARGRWPAVVLLAGSGPTDRDWNSPALAARNGSGRLLAAELASRGHVVLRFDKAFAGANTGLALDALTLDTYRDEGLAAVAFVRARPEVRADRVFVAGHSEGGIPATRVALAVRPALAGVIYLSSAVRPMRDIILEQIEGNLRQPGAGIEGPRIAAEMATLRAALAAFGAGHAVDPAAATTIPALQRVVAGLVAPATAPLMRELLAYDTAAHAAALAPPVLVLTGGKDVQIDPARDARYLVDALARAHRQVTFHLAPDADHVLKHEPRSLGVLRADRFAVQHRYNADDRALDRDAVEALVTWLDTPR